MDVVVEKNVEARMRDGAVLRADVYRPAAEGRYPVIVQRTPYNKEALWLVGSNLDPVRAAAMGLVVVIQDVRARWASDGTDFFPYRYESDDGHDTVQWAAGLPYSSGRVGLYGLSYMGASSWHAAATAPPALAAIAPTTAPNDFFANHLWRGGAFLLGTLSYWALQAIGPAALIRGKGGGPDFFPALLGLVEDIDRYDERVRHRPLRSFPPARPGDEEFVPFFFEVLEHPTRDEFTRRHSVSHRHGDVAVPALIVAGWHDLLLAADLEHYASVRAEGATAAAREGTRLVIGPWSHGMFLNVVGEQDLGFRSSGLFLDLREDLTTMHARWFAPWLGEGADAAGADPAATAEAFGPRVKLFVQGTGRWRDEDDWPLARARDVRWHLRAGGGLSEQPPAVDEGYAAYVYDPEDPCPTRGGTLLMPRHHTPGPVDQRPLLGRRDVLVYRSEVLQADIEVTGHVRAILHAATSAPDTDWVVKLCDLWPDGRMLNVCDGVLRASYRESLERRVAVEPGVVVRYEIDLWATSIVFGAGHRIAVLVSSSDFPRYDRNPNTGELGVEAAGGEPALQRVFHDAERASHLVLPVVG